MSAASTTCCIAKLRAGVAHCVVFVPQVLRSARRPDLDIGEIADRRQQVFRSATRAHFAESAAELSPSEACAP